MDVDIDSFALDLQYFWYPTGKGRSNISYYPHDKVLSVIKGYESDILGRTEPDSYGLRAGRFWPESRMLLAGLNRTTKRADEPLSFTLTDAGSYRIASCFGRFAVWSRMCALIVCTNSSQLMKQNKGVLDYINTIF
ncbi:hypothetical protein DY000_02052362 [Brassica cretica]|uniref:Uncharacterized protein n=1 Tax=Brassica cretica TaxID=69181 RepID=A0ABQ7ADA5_BRACR|nr:hypothetical protein DY000_02052362 [Brassica cretica]